ncbi:hypothetical protein [Pontivivens insulae]|uniref:Uncharacterized protein n=1 Tax=Pontivivens insulae TaxID=1639689 RepID=A0A2R8A8Q3_9RHOB|nr:hypothetical protein [Pontivivens insulae]RED18627.1 hypothetical protein DFR53_0825 [Pontivivens insulae]SPF28525.1 hypothetical protein POI8812_00826 [Pontivivens insulae]
MFKRLLPCILALAVAAPMPAAATVTSDEGVTYDQQRNRYGVVLRAGDDVIYLGVSCDVLSEARGEGKWATTSDQVILDFFDRSLSLQPIGQFVGRDIAECAL